MSMDVSFKVTGRTRQELEDHATVILKAFDETLDNPEFSISAVRPAVERQDIDTVQLWEADVQAVV